MMPPSISAAYGMYTESGSWAAGVAHLGVWGQNRWRYLGAATGLGLNLSISGSGTGGEERLFEYSLDGWALTQHLRYRIGSSDWWVGALYDYLQMSTVFALDELPGVDPLELDSNLGSLGFGVRFDNRSNTFTPDRGVFADVTVKRRDDMFGSDFDYWGAQGTLLGYVDPLDELVLGLRATAGVAGDAAPFWARPSVSIRGIALGRYTGDMAGVSEGEARFDVSRRWSLVGFGGAGWVANDDDESGVDRWLGSGGGGFRYLIARAFGVRGGIDVAYSTDGLAFYVTMGSAWAGT